MDVELNEESIIAAVLEAESNGFSVMPVSVAYERFGSAYRETCCCPLGAMTLKRLPPEHRSSYPCSGFAGRSRQFASEFISGFDGGYPEDEPSPGYILGRKFRERALAMHGAAYDS